MVGQWTFFIDASKMNKMFRPTKIKKSYTPLIILSSVAVVALLIGLLAMYKRVKPPPPQSQQEQTDIQTGQNENQTPTLPEEQGSDPLSSTTGWKTYTNDKHGFFMLYPTNLKAGSVSSNSVLGTYQVPVKGFHVGSLVFVVLKDQDLKKDALDYFNSTYTLALHPPTVTEGLSVACEIHKVPNSFVSIKSVSCEGEGGPARYDYITGKEYDVFVDGYSKGFDNQANGTLAKATDYSTILSTFRFIADVSATNPGSQVPAPFSSDQPAIKVVTIVADDSGATPSEISVAAGTIVQLTFSVGTNNVYYGGLDFRSSVVSSGTIYAGTSKTVTFKANQSFEFTPYWPASGVAKNYKIKITVQ